MPSENETQSNEHIFLNRFFLFKYCIECPVVTYENPLLSLRKPSGNGPVSFWIFLCTVFQRSYEQSGEAAAAVFEFRA